MPTLRFVHFVRDGRDMAFSDNQNQLDQARLGSARAELLELKKPLQLDRALEPRQPPRGRLRRADLGEPLLRVRFEDLCADPERHGGARILDFFGLEGDAGAVARAEVSPPRRSAAGGGRNRPPFGALEEIAAPALARFGYL